MCYLAKPLGYLDEVRNDALVFLCNETTKIIVELARSVEKQLNV